MLSKSGYLICLIFQALFTLVNKPPFDPSCPCRKIQIGWSFSGPYHCLGPFPISTHHPVPSSTFDISDSELGLGGTIALPGLCNVYAGLNSDKEALYAFFLWPCILPGVSHSRSRSAVVAQTSSIFFPIVQSVVLFSAKFGCFHSRGTTCSHLC